MIKILAYVKYPYTKRHVISGTGMEKEISNGKGIAIASIWIGVGICSFGMGLFAVIVAFIAALCTDTIVKN